MVPLHHPNCPEGTTRAARRPGVHRRKPASFMSEHTAEFALLQNLCLKIGAFEPSLFPIFYWKSREGSALASQCMSGATVRILMVFPRRPKVYRPGQTSVRIKFNEEILAAARIALRHGIPTIAGMPLVSSLAAYNLSCDCAWFRLSAERPSPNEELDIPLAAPDEPTSDTSPIPRLSRNADFRAIVQADCRRLDWSSACSAIDDIKRGSGDSPRFFWGSIYRPVFLVMQDDAP